ncbi:MAG: GNAT family N-acetyltransferase [Ilumatobacter sp.]
MAHPYWPLFDLEIRFEELTLRYPDDDTLLKMVALAAEGIHDDDEMPFSVPWTRGETPDLECNALRFHWRTRADASPESIRIPLAVFRDDELVGASDLIADDFATLRQFETGSWLGRRFQGRGIGTKMRRATLCLGFDGLGAEWASTAAWEDNPASLGVTRSLGYQRQGTRRANREGHSTNLVGYEMHRSHFDAIRPDSITMNGIDGVCEFLGVEPPQ